LAVEDEDRMPGHDTLGDASPGAAQRVVRVNLSDVGAGRTLPVVCFTSPSWFQGSEPVSKR